MEICGSARNPLFLYTGLTRQVRAHEVVGSIPHYTFKGALMKKFIFYFPERNKTIIIKARNKAHAVWKLLNQYRLRENEVDYYQVIQSNE